MPKRKKEPAAQLAAFELPHRPVPQMPEGYYSGDKPNPNLRAFVEAHELQHPFNSSADSYNKPGFVLQVMIENRRDPINDLHIYWSKKPYEAIREYIRHYTSPGDLVLDPFCGSGGTALAALMEGRKAIAIDRSPAATFITKNYCTPVDVVALQTAFEELKARVQPEMDWLYETRCDRCGGTATTGYTVYSQVFQCPRCLEKVPLFDCVEEESETAAGKPKTISACPYCHKRGFVEEISTRGERFGAVPVLVSYLCEGKCKPKRDERRHNDSDPKKREYFRKYDLGKLREIDGKPIPHWYPTDRMMHAPEDQEQWGVKWRAGTSNFRTVDELFSKRNLWALAAVFNALVDAKQQREQFLFAFSGALLNATVMYRQRELGGGPQVGTYYLPQVFREVKVETLFEQKVDNLLRSGNYYKPQDLPQVCISTQSAIDLGAIADNSVDFIFTDPPYAEKVQYGELNFIWEVWLGLDTNWHDDEIIVNSVRGKSEEDWARMMRQAMTECYRVLRPGRWLSLCYHDTSEGTWTLVQEIMAEIGFAVDATDTVLFIDTGQKAYNQLVADKVTKRDLVINFRKPRPGELHTTIQIRGDEDATTFSEQARGLIRAALVENPGATKDRIYDVVVSRMVRAGQMEAHNFDELLAQVAEPMQEPVKQDLFTDKPADLFGYNTVTRWYLKETETGADESQQKVEQAAAEKIEQFLRQTTAEELRRTLREWEDLRREQAEKKHLLAVTPEDDPAVKRPKVIRELREIERQLQKLEAERAEWEQSALHYSPILEFYLPLSPKPRLTLIELLEDYFYQTEAGNWRPPADEAERESRVARRGQTAHRQIRRFCRLLMAGEAIPSNLQPDSASLAEWIRYCKRNELFEEGKLLFEKGGLDLDALPEEAQVAVEEDYQVCVRRLAASG